MSDPSPNVEVAIATLTVTVTALTGTVEGLRSELRQDRLTYVPRGEWEQRNRTVDSNFSHQGREIGQLRSDINSRRAPWWSTVAVVVAAASLVWSVLGPVLRGG